MKQLTIRHFIAGVIFLVLLSCILPSCATTRQSQIDEQRRGLMMQDKAEYSRNKRHYKGSKPYKKQKRRTKYYKRSKPYKRR